MSCTETSILKFELSLLAIFPINVPASLNKTSPPSASKIISPATSSVKSPELKSISVPSMVILSTTTPAFAVTAPLKVPVVAVTELLNVAAPASLISNVNAVMLEPPSFPWKIISLSLTAALIVKLLLPILISPISVVASSNKIEPLSESKVILPATSTSNEPVDKSISVPSIVILSTVIPPFDSKDVTAVTASTTLVPLLYTHIVLPDGTPIPEPEGVLTVIISAVPLWTK